MTDVMAREEGAARLREILGPGDHAGVDPVVLR